MPPTAHDTLSKPCHETTRGTRHANRNAYLRARALAWSPSRWITRCRRGTAGERRPIRPEGIGGRENPRVPREVPKECPCNATQAFHGVELLSDSNCREHAGESWRPVSIDLAVRPAQDGSR